MPSRLLTAALFATFAAAQPQLPAPADPANRATVEGIVLGAGRQPLPNSGVTLSGGVRKSGDNGAVGSSYNAAADASGRFSISGIRPGLYRIGAQHPDYTSADDPGEFTDWLQSAARGLPIDPGPGAVNLTGGQHLTGIEIELIPMTVLAGKVTDENGDPMKGVTVRPMRADTVVNGQMRLTNAAAGWLTGPDGKFNFSVAAGRWYLSFIPQRPEAETTPATTPVPVEPEVSYVPTYYPGVRSENLSIPMTPAATADCISLTICSISLVATAVWSANRR